MSFFEFGFKYARDGITKALLREILIYKKM